MVRVTKARLGWRVEAHGRTRWHLLRRTALKQVRRMARMEHPASSDGF